MFRKLFGLKDKNEEKEEKLVEENLPKENSTEELNENEIETENKNDEFYSKESIENAKEITEENIVKIEENIDNEVVEEKVGFFKKLAQGLSKTSKDFSQKLDKIFMGYNVIDDSIYENLEEFLILSDVGFETSLSIVEELRHAAIKKNLSNTNELKEEFKNIVRNILESSNEKHQLTYPNITVIIGVNGVGKTTSIGKLASQYKNNGKKVTLAAADTFRAAAADQLEIWANRAEVDIIRKNEGADPSSVIFDAIQFAKKDGTDILICDTAGRLHNKKNLMDELSKIFRIIDREYPEASKEVYLVVDATTGQNALSQVKTFSEVTNLTGIILTKLDGTAKGGVVIGISKEFNIPIRYIGVGEQIADLQEFDSNMFAEALFLEM